MQSNKKETPGRLIYWHLSHWIVIKIPGADAQARFPYNPNVACELLTAIMALANEKKNWRKIRIVTQEKNNNKQKHRPEKLF